MTRTSKFEIFVNNDDISSYVKTAETSESTVEWFVHVTLEGKGQLSETLAKYDGSSVSVEFRIVLICDNGEEVNSSPWHSGLGVAAWRLDEDGNDELILYGTGRLDRDDSKSNKSDDDTPTHGTHNNY